MGKINPKTAVFNGAGTPERYAEWKRLQTQLNPEKEEVSFSLQEETNYQCTSVTFSICRTRAYPAPEFKKDPEIVKNRRSRRGEHGPVDPSQASFQKKRAWFITQDFIHSCDKKQKNKQVFNKVFSELEKTLVDKLLKELQAQNVALSKDLFEKAKTTAKQMALSQIGTENGQTLANERCPERKPDSPFLPVQIRLPKLAGDQNGKTKRVFEIGDLDFAHFVGLAGTALSKATRIFAETCQPNPFHLGSQNCPSPTLNLGVSEDFLENLGWVAVFTGLFVGFLEVGWIAEEAAIEGMQTNALKKGMEFLTKLKLSFKTKGALIISVTVENSSDPESQSSNRTPINLPTTKVASTNRAQASTVKPSQTKPIVVESEDGKVKIVKPDEVDQNGKTLPNGWIMDPEQLRFGPD